MQNERIYMIEKDSRIFNKWRHCFEGPMEEIMEKRKLIIRPEELINKNSERLFEMVCTLQHYPHLYDLFLFSIDLEFIKITGTGIYRDDETGILPIFSWFETLSDFPALYFFLSKKLFRSYAMLGINIPFYDDISMDLNKENKLGSRLTFAPEISIRILDKMNSALMMMQLYFHGTDHKIDRFIEQLRKEEGIPVDIDYLNSSLEANIRYNKR